MRRPYLLILLPAALLSACVASAVQDNYGRAMEQMRDAQIFDRSTLSSPGDRAVTGVDSEAAKAAIDSMRKDTPDRAVVRQNIPINVSTQPNTGNQ
jgi:hypothetical protein